MANLSYEEFYNSHKILLVLKEIGEIYIYSTYVFDYILKEKVKIFYLKHGKNSYPISKDQFEKLKTYGIKEINI